MDEWTVFRLTDDALATLGRGGEGGPSATGRAAGRGAAEDEPGAIGAELT
jgi:hypothetical protein